MRAVFFFALGLARFAFFFPFFGAFFFAFGFGFDAFFFFFAGARLGLGGDVPSSIDGVYSGAGTGSGAGSGGNIGSIIPGPPIPVNSVVETIYVSSAGCVSLGAYSLSD
ncbi:MAG TPA: hypothetical protein VNG35_11375 [Gemmatimonadales bacterium]|nr:hypothetical protein [Gemmatimonadales bacterium]